MGKMDFILNYHQYLENIDDSSIDDDMIMFNEIKNQSKFGRLAIVEGYIKTHPLNKSINIIQRKFPNLKCEIEQDGEIYIEGNFDKLDKYIPLFTNLGYFISTLTIDGDEWIKSYDNSTKPIALYLEPKYDYEITNIPNVLYHASPLKFKDKILKYGLSPRTGNKLSNHPERIYLTDSYKNACNFGYYLEKDNNVYYKDGFCIYSIDGSKLVKLYSDINFRIGGYYIMGNINPVDIKLIKTFS